MTEERIASPNEALDGAKAKVSEHQVDSLTNILIPNKSPYRPEIVAKLLSDAYPNRDFSGMTAAEKLPAEVPSRLVVKYGEHSEWREIVQEAEREKVDVIVLGAHSQGSFPRPVLGSTAEKVSRHVKVPVLLVR